MKVKINTTYFIILTFLIFISGLIPKYSYSQQENDNNQQTSDNSLLNFDENEDEDFTNNLPRIKKVYIEGNKRISRDDILSTIRSRAGLIFSSLRVRNDVRALFRLGLFKDIEVEMQRNTQGVTLIYRVTELPIIRNIIFRGNDEIDDDKIEEVIDLQKGSFLKIPDLRKNMDKIRDLYTEKGYLLAEVHVEIRNNPNTNEVDVIFNITENYQVEIREINFIGNNNLASDKIRSIMQTQAADTFILSFLSDGGKFKEEYFERDKMAIAAFYADFGYLQAHIGEPRINLSADYRYIYITIPVEEGDKYKVGRIRIEEIMNNKLINPLGGRAKIKELILSQRDEWFNRSKIQQDIFSIMDYYKNHGYAYVNVTPRTSIDEEAKVVDITFEIERGPIVYIERIDIRGNEKTRDKVIRREMQIGEGQRYNQKLVNQSKRRIMMTGYFEDVEIETERGSEENLTIVKVKVKEKSTGNIQIGAGFSTMENFVFTAQLTQQNFLGYGIDASILAQISGLRQIFRLNIVEPSFLDSNWIFSFDVYDTVRVYEDYNKESTGGSIGFGYPILPDLRTYLSYRGEYIRIRSQDEGLIFSANSPYQGIFTSLPLANLFDDGFSSSIKASISYDTRNNRIYPSSGTFNSIAVEYADWWLGSENSFLRWSFTSRWYFPIIWDIVFKINAEFGLIYNPYGIVPIYERYRPGGIFSIRGFSPYSLGPRISIAENLDPNDTPVSGGVIIGGNYEIVFNAELEFPIIPPANIRGVFFFDAGNSFNLEDIWCDSFRGSEINEYTNPCNSDPWNLRTSVGFGFRWFSPLGPFRFEFGIPLDRQPGEDDIDFQFTIGNVF